MKQFMIYIFHTALLLTLAGCHSNDHSDDGHGHEHGGGASVTQWSDKTELFMEYPPLVAGEQATFVIHLSNMADFSAVTEGTLVCLFSRGNGTAVRFEEEVPGRPGIYLPDVTLNEPGEYDLELRLVGPQVSDTIQVAGIKVYESEAALPHVDEEAAGDEISFLKEQQWKIDFRTEPAQSRSLLGSISALGELLPKPQSHAEVPAPANGIILVDQNKQLPSIGTWVSKGEVLAVISPPANSDNSLNKIRSQFLLAKAEYERAQRLYEQEAIPEKRLEESRLLYDAQKASYDVIANQIDFGSSEENEQSSVPHFHLKAPIDGYIETIDFHVGENVQAGRTLFKITNPRRLLLKANVPVARIAALQSASDASFRVEGFEREYQVSQLNGRLLSVGNTVDDISRTVPVYFEFDNPENALKIGLFAQVSVKIGKPILGTAIPQSAVFDEDGTPVAFVHTEGESFSKRILRTGISDNGYILATSGIAAGERVVTVGGYQIKLASLSTSVPTGHGHAH